MNKTIKTMTDREVLARSKKVGSHVVGGVKGLTLRVRQNASGTLSALWLVRIQADGKDRKKSLGSYPAISLSKARELAAKFTATFSDGRDPFQEAEEKKQTKKRKTAQKAKEAVTFEAALSEWLDYKQERDWKHKEETRIKEEKRIRNHLGLLMPLSLSAITPENVADALRPIWCERKATADRLLIYIRGYLRWAMTVKKCRERSYNPAELQFIEDLLPPTNQRKKEVPMPALSVEQMPLFMKAVHERAKTHLSALCLEFAILTCSRSANVRQMRWEQFSEDLSLWEIDAEEMKITRNGQHKIPLSRQAKMVLQEVKARCFDEEWAFPSERKAGYPLSNSTLNQAIRSLHAVEIKAGREGWIDREQSKREKVPVVAVQHGISRATFKTWAEGTRQDTRAVELVLHHEIDPRLRGAYDRSEDMEQKATVLQNWADFCYSMIDSE